MRDIVILPQFVRRVFKFLSILGCTMSRRRPANSNKLVEDQLSNLHKGLERTLDSDLLLYRGPIHPGLDSEIRDALEAITSRRPKLSVILDTGGGVIEVTQRIADTFRHHYSVVDFLVPNMAMSAGTVLVMSGDAIWMDYFSVLGPIDPQVPRSDGRGLVPALGYLEYYQRLIAKSQVGKLTTAELHFLTSKFDPAELYHYEQARNLSIRLLEQWLATYKFKDWSETETKKTPVTPEMKAQRARQIAVQLSDTQRWLSHGRGISMATLRQDLNLQIDDLEANPDLHAKVRDYYNFVVDYMERRGQRTVLHTNGRLSFSVGS